MTEQQETVQSVVTIGESYRGGVPNFMIEHARFFGRPNFSGEMDRFKDSRHKFTVMIPDEAVGPLQSLGYNVKTTVPDQEDIEMGREPINHLKVMVDVGSSDVWVIQGEDREKLNETTMGIVDRSRFEDIGMEIRAWCYNKEEVDAGREEPKYSARLVTFAGVMRPNLLESKYGRLR